MTRRGGAVEVDFLSFRKLAAFFFEVIARKEVHFPKLPPPTTILPLSDS
jgi:hypothetical protein